MEADNNEPPEDSSNEKSLLASADDGSQCPICFDNWTTHGEHRICCLKCGHLFGASCLDKWLAKNNTCPTCKRKMNKKDITFLYAKKVIAMDTSQLTILEKEVTRLTEEKNRLKIELAKSLCIQHTQQCELSAHKLKLATLISNSSSGNITSTSTTQRNDLKLYMEKSLEISKEGECRVLDFNEDLNLLVVSSKPPTTNLFSTQYGIKKISVEMYKSIGFLCLHQKVIRDIKFHPQNPWLLSVSLGNTIKVTDLNSNSRVGEFAANGPSWSCCWDSGNPNVFYVGEQQGDVTAYDIRKPSENLATISIAGDASPVVSLASIAPNTHNYFPHGGLICCKLNSLWVFLNSGNEYSQHPLPTVGPFLSMSYQNNTQHLLISARPNSQTNFARHMFSSIENNVDNEIKCNLIHTFQGGNRQKFLTRSCLFLHNENYVAAYHETLKTVCIWSVTTGSRVTSIPAHEQVKDICYLTSKGSEFLACLSEKKADFFKFTN